MQTSTTEQAYWVAKKIRYWQLTKTYNKLIMEGYPVVITGTLDPDPQFVVARGVKMPGPHGERKETAKWAVRRLRTGGTVAHGTEAKTITTAITRAAACLRGTPIRLDIIATKMEKLTEAPMSPYQLHDPIEKRGKEFYVWWEQIVGPFSDRKAAEAALAVAKGAIS